MSDDLSVHLARLGLDPTAILAYCRLLAVGPDTPDGLAGALSLAPVDVDAALETLGRIGLVRRSADGRQSVVPVTPGLGVDLLAREREAELRAAQVAARTAYDTFRRTVWSHPTDELIEVVTGAAAMAERSRQAERSATDQLRRFDTAPYLTDAVVNPGELTNLARGVVYRVIYARSSVERREYYENNIRPCLAAGEQSRVLASVPVKLTLVDDRLALVARSVTEADIHSALLLVHPSPLLSALTGLFETSWRAAFPLHLGEHPPSSLRPAERRLLDLMGAGVPDEKIAELLGISRRTLMRRLERLMALAGATNRFQLALHASRNGWL